MYHNNNSEKHCISARRLRRIRSQKARKLLVCLTALLCMAFVGATVAFVVAQTNSVKNTFQGSRVACAVLENGSTDETSGVVNDVMKKENVQIKNTGDTQSYIRAKVVVTWMAIDSDGKVSVTAAKPVEDKDYTIVFAGEADGETSTAWQLAADGYWYYTEPVNVGTTTTNLIHNCSLTQPANVPEGYFLSVEIVASAIQSTPTSVVTTQWSSNGNGVTGVNGTTLTVKEPAVAN